MKRILLLISVLALTVFVALGVKAHPGRTDGSGGHTNHSTGEYHYHHGHPAHDHYDMDGDGDIDCPYDFDDQTTHSSNTSSFIQDTSDNNAESNKTFDAETSIVIGIAVILIGFWIAPAFFGKK